MYRTILNTRFSPKSTDIGRGTSFLTQRIGNMFLQKNYRLKHNIYHFLRIKTYIQYSPENMFYLCGQAAYKLGYKIVGKQAVYTHNPQNGLVLGFLKSYTHFYTSAYARSCTQKCAQFTSVNQRFYTLYTAPTITTTLNN
jgi:hypothetical protein